MKLSDKKFVSRQNKVDLPKVAAEDIRAAMNDIYEYESVFNKLADPRLLNLDPTPSGLELDTPKPQQYGHPNVEPQNLGQVNHFGPAIMEEMDAQEQAMAQQPGYLPPSKNPAMGPNLMNERARQVDLKKKNLGEPVYDLEQGPDIAPELANRPVHAQVTMNAPPPVQGSDNDPSHVGTLITVDQGLSADAVASLVDKTAQIAGGFPVNVFDINENNVHGIAFSKEQSLDPGDMLKFEGNPQMQVFKVTSQKMQPDLQSPDLLSTLNWMADTNMIDPNKVKELDKNLKEGAYGNSPAGTAGSPIDGQRDTLSKEEIPGTGKIGYFAQKWPLVKANLHCDEEKLNQISRNIMAMVKKAQTDTLTEKALVKLFDIASKRSKVASVNDLSDKVLNITKLFI
jgi:hypothetical protein